MNVSQGIFEECKRHMCKLLSEERGKIMQIVLTLNEKKKEYTQKLKTVAQNLRTERFVRFHIGIIFI